MSGRLLLVVLLLGGAGCSGLEEDRPLGEQVGADDRSEFVEGFLDGAGGVLAESEAECMADTVLASDLTPRDLAEAQQDPTVAARVLDADALAACIDPGLDLRVPIEGDVRERLTDDLLAEGIDDAQAACVLDGLVAAGFDARDFLLAGVSASGDFESTAFELFDSCT